jgi:glyoxylase-like metal-dependent hydrolase (beta-lactamase superfamily II)
MSKAEIDYYGFRCSNLHALNHMDEISIGETNVTCLHTPGHSAGGMCYLLSDSIFTGDTIFIEGCGICDSKGSSPEQMYDSIQLVKGLLTPNTLIYPSHSFGRMPGQNFDFVMKENIYFQIDDKNFFVEFRMRKNQKGLFDFK